MIRKHWAAFVGTLLDDDAYARPARFPARLVIVTNAGREFKEILLTRF
jgi:hypothetical protein